MGAHQKIDRVARRHLRYLAPSDQRFPGIRMILQFEGKNGPDGIKRKSPAKDEPWHFLDPFDDEDIQLTTLIQNHYDALVQYLREENKERAAFEAAWLAHAIVDGLTPAHHYPYEEKLAELRGGSGLETRNSIRQKLVIRGDTKIEMIRNNWKMWGGKGLFMTHGTFELGVASVIAPLNFAHALPTPEQIAEAQNIGIAALFRRTAKEVARQGIYDRYYQKGWTQTLAAQVRNNLGPAIVRTVTLAWYSALQEVRTGA